MKKHVKQNLWKQLTFQLIILKKKYIQNTSQIIEIIPEILKQFLSEFSFLKGTNQYKISAIISIIVNTTKTVFLASITLHLRNDFLVRKSEFKFKNIYHLNQPSFDLLKSFITISSIVTSRALEIDITISFSHSILNLTYP